MTSGAGAARFEGKVGFVTGAAGGIGLAVARGLAAGGAAGVVIADVDADRLETAADAVSSDGRDDLQVVGLVLDVTDDDAVAAAIDEVVDRCGGLDLAYNNAGITGAWAPIVDHPLEEWHRVIATNLTSVFSCMRHEIRAMMATGGAIVNASSGAGHVGSPGQAGYVAAKHGVLGLTRTAAREVATAGIRVNAVCPGTTRTPMLEGFISGDPETEARLAKISPMRRLGEADEVAAAVLFLLSDEASFVNGHSLDVDGGALSR